VISRDLRLTESVHDQPGLATPPPRDDHGDGAWPREAGRDLEGIYPRAVSMVPRRRVLGAAVNRLVL
jgi:hypothetical protein